MPKPIKIGPGEDSKPKKPILSQVSNPQPEIVKTEETENSGRTIKRFIVNQNNQGGTTVVAAAAPGRSHKIIGFILFATGNGSLIFRSGPTSAGNLTGPMDIRTTASLIWPSNPAAPFVETARGESLSIVTAQGGVRGLIIFITE